MPDDRIQDDAERPRRARRDEADEEPPRRRRIRRDDDDDEGGGMNSLIPYKNPQALIAYYLGVFSLIPIIGFLLGIAALVLGLRGLKYRKTHPTSGGTGHAWAGIILGSLVLLGHLVLVAFIVVLANAK